MDNIIEFPTRSTRDWVTIERSLRIGLRQLNISAATEARLVDRMKTFWDTLELDFQFSFDMSFEIDGSMSDNYLNSKMPDKPERAQSRTG